MKMIIVGLLLFILGLGCKSATSEKQAIVDIASQKTVQYFDTTLGVRKIIISSDSERMYVAIREQDKVFIDTIHYSISKDYDDLTKNICIDGKDLTNCFVSGDLLFFTFNDFSYLKRLVTVNLNTHQIVAVKDGEDMLGTYLLAFLFVDNIIVCCHDPNLDGKDQKLWIYTFTPDAIACIGTKTLKINGLKLFTNDSAMTSFLKVAYDNVHAAPPLNKNRSTSARQRK